MKEIQTGWFCPNCENIISPYEKTCTNCESEEEEKEIMFWAFDPPPVVTKEYYEQKKSIIEK